MKQFFMLAALAALVFTSCDKNEATAPTEKAEKTGSTITLALGSESGTRAFGTGATETWEKAVNKATVLVFNTAGALKFRRDLSSAEIAAMATTPVELVIPDVAAGDNCDFAVVANRTVPATVVTKTLLLAETESDAAAYNGTFADVTTKALRSGGFAMSGLTTQAIAATGTTAVTVVLKRPVAKVEIEAATSATFATKYGSATVTVNSIVLSRGETGAMLIDQSTLTTPKYAAAGSTFSSTQTSSANRNLFYLFEKPAAAAGSRVLLTLNATYDADGVSSTTGDQTPLTYTVEMDGASGGKILRNGAYKVAATINGLTGKDVALTVTVSSWETLATQTVSLGE